MHKLSFTLTSEPKGIPGDITVEVDKTILKNGDSYRMDKNSQKEFNINPLYKYYANWTIDGGNVSIEHVWGNDVWSYGAKITTGEQTGIITVTVKDQTGKSMSFEINVTEQIFPDDIHIVDDETGKKAEGAVYIPCGGSKIFRLSDNNYKGKWSTGQPAYYIVEPISPDENGYCTKVKITATKDAWQKDTHIHVVDKANLKSVSFDGLYGGIDFSKINNPSLKSGDVQIYPMNSWTFYNFIWNGKKTDFSRNFYLTDKNSTIYNRLPGVTFSVEKTDEDSGFTIGTDQTMMQRTGDIPVRWKEKYGREAILTLTDHWGQHMSFSFKPRIDFFSGKWKLHQDYKYADGRSITTWTYLTHATTSGQKAQTVEAVVNYDTISKENGWGRHEIYLINEDDNNGFDNEHKCYYIECKVKKVGTSGYISEVLNAFDIQKYISTSSSYCEFMLVFKDSDNDDCRLYVKYKK